ncbi:MAG: hypothetical protein JW888_17335, partial [Pirellulales bacterium]|nr:hypothetical protein [Pirellulales bacterium]
MHSPSRLTNLLACLLAAGAMLSAAPAPAERAVRPESKPEKLVREILVPMDDLNFLLENQPRRVLLSRDEYEALLEKSRADTKAKPPRPAVLTDSAYTTTVTDGRAAIEGTLSLEVLSDGVQVVPLELAHVGLKSATLDGKPAAIGREKNGPLTLFVEGRGPHELRLSMTAPVETTAATQVLTCRLPAAPSARFDLSITGDVEVKGGLDVINRRLDAAAGVTHFKLLPRAGDVSLVMTLNSHLRRKDQIVVARSVLLASIAESGEALHSTVSLSVLHRAADRFRFLVPEGFEITQVASPTLSSWDIVDEDSRRILEVRLREATTGEVVLSISAERNTPRLDDWTLPRLQPLETDGEVTVVGLLLEDRLKPKTISATGLIPINASVLDAAMPESLSRGTAGQSPLRAVAAYYAPGGDYAIQARFEKPPAALDATTVLLLTLDDGGARLRGDVVLAAKHERLFDVDLGLPAAWHVERVTNGQGQPIPFERHENPARVHVRLPGGIAPGQQGLFKFEAASTPPEWLADWKQFTVEFPDCRVLGNVNQRGAIAVAAKDDLGVRPEDETGLVPLDEAQKKDFRLSGVATDLAYRHENGRFKATLKAQRKPPRLTAKTYSFLRIAPGMLVGHYEIVYDVAEARTRSLQFRLPSTTPADLAIRGLSGVSLKQYVPESTHEGRLWTIQLAEARRGPIALAVDFQQPLGEKDPRDLPLPVIVAEGVAHQSGLVAVEGNAELDVQVTTTARAVDVGELVGADYQPGRRLLGVYSFVGQPGKVQINAYRHPAYRLSAAIVQKGNLTTKVSADGVAQTDARFQLRTKALYLEVRLPAGAELWSAWLDGRPVKPQRQADRLLLNLAGAAGDKPRELQLVYETPVAPVSLLGHVELTAPTLLLRDEEDGEPSEVPLAGLQWELVLPWCYTVVDSDSTLMTNAARLPKPAVFEFVRFLGLSAVGRGGLGCVAARRKSAAPCCECVMPPTDELSALDETIANAEREVTQLGIAIKAEGLQDPKLENLRRELHDLEQTVVIEKSQANESEARIKRQRAIMADLADELGTADANKLSEGQRDRLRELKTRYQALATLKERRKQLRRESSGELSDQEVEFDLDTDAPADRPYQAFGRRASDVKTDVALGGSYKYGSYSGGPALGLGGIGNPKFDLAQNEAGDVLSSVTFQSLGEQPRLNVTLANRERFDVLGWGVSMVIVLAGMAIGCRPARTKFRFLVAVGLVASLLPMMPGCQALAEPCNMAFYAAILLIPYYGVLAVARCCLQWFKKNCLGKCAAPTAAAVLLVLAASLAAVAAERPRGDGPVKVELIDPLPAIRVPNEAILVPYDPDSPSGIENADRCFVPYDQYLELWRRANPDKDQKATAAADYALAGASYSATLADGK